MGKLTIFLSLNWNAKRIFLESFLYLAWGKVLKSIPFSKVAPYLGDPMQETPFTLNPSHKKVLAEVSQAINITSKYTFWESQCLVKAIAAMKMLERRKIESTLYLGTAKDENGKLVAHAWLRSGPFYITGYEVMDQFTVVGKFAKCSNAEN